MVMDLTVISPYGKSGVLTLKDPRPKPSPSVKTGQRTTERGAETKATVIFCGSGLGVGPPTDWAPCPIPAAETPAMQAFVVFTDRYSFEIQAERGFRVAAFFVGRSRGWRDV